MKITFLFNMGEGGLYSNACGGGGGGARVN